MVAAVLGKQLRVLRTSGNLNNEYGLPLCLLRAEAYHDIAVLEMGMSAAGEIAKLASIAEPNEGLITNVNPVHLEFFKSIDGIAAAKAELLAGLVAGAGGDRRAYLNNDDSRVRRMSRRFDGEIVTYGVRAIAAFQARSVEVLGLDGTAFTVHHGRRDVNFVLPMAGAHNVSNAVAAISVGATHGVDWQPMREAIEGMVGEKMRGAVVRFREGFAVINDCYNSNPAAVEAAVAALDMSAPGRRVAFLGDMLELGPQGPELHRETGRKVAARLDAVVGVGALARHFLEGAREAGLPATALLSFPDSPSAAAAASGLVRPGDAVLVKGSRGVRMEQVVDALTAALGQAEG